MKCRWKVRMASAPGLDPLRCEAVLPGYTALGGQGVNRTLDTGIFSPLLYRLSYLPAGLSNG